MEGYTVMVMLVNDFINYLFEVLDEFWTEILSSWVHGHDIANDFLSQHVPLGSFLLQGNEILNHLVTLLKVSDLTEIFDEVNQVWDCSYVVGFNCFRDTLYEISFKWLHNFFFILFTDYFFVFKDTAQISNVLERVGLVVVW